MATPRAEKHCTRCEKLRGDRVGRLVPACSTHKFRGFFLFLLEIPSADRVVFLRIQMATAFQHVCTSTKTS